MEDRDLSLETGGAAIIDILDSLPLSVKQMACEFIDNSFGAGASVVSIRKRGQFLTISDDGSGCPNPEVMFSVARSYRHSADRAGRFGLGCPFSMIKGSRKGQAKVITVHEGIKYTTIVDWAKCSESGVLKANSCRITVAGPGEPSGTTIILSPSIRIELDELAEWLSFSYAKELRAGKRIILEVNGREIDLRPFEPPAASRGSKVKIDMEVGGFRVTGRGWLVPEKVHNPHPGWSIHYGYRFFKTTTQPGDGKNCNRIYAEVYLPSEWKNIGVTKDYFKDQPEDLYLAIQEQFASLIEQSDASRKDDPLLAATKAVEDYLSQTLLGPGRVKGSRPGRAGKKGTVQPTGKGGAHQDFTTTQDGDKADSPFAKREPQRVLIVWEASDKLCQVKVDGLKGKSLRLILSSSQKETAIFKDAIEHLKTLCLVLLAQWIARGSEDSQRVFPELQEMDFEEALQKLMSRADPRPPKLEQTA